MILVYGVNMLYPMCVSFVFQLDVMLVVFGAADVGDIQSRLLDHRPIINAEIRYFVREFEVLVLFIRLHTSLYLGASGLLTIM